MVVVAAFAILSAILVPNFIKAREKARLNAEMQQSLLPEPAALPKGKAPQLSRADINIGLEVKPVRVGLDVANRYQIDHRGLYEFASSGEGEQVLIFELPEALQQVESLRLHIQQRGDWVEPPDVIYDRGFVAWVVPAESFPLVARLNYRALGQDELVYPWPVVGKMENLKVELSLTESAEMKLPLWGIRPSSQEGSDYFWAFESLIAPAPIVLEFSALNSPLGQVGQLFRLSGLALLLFGAGFWYLAELYKIGSLKDFRMGSFFLLAGTYWSFFIAVAVLGFDGRMSAPLYIALSMALTLPLLVFHVRQLVDFRFALTRALPLALFTLSLVLLGVYGGGIRHLGFLGFGLLSVAFLTATYRPYVETQNIRKRRIQEQEAELARQCQSLREQAQELQTAMMLRLESSPPLSPLFANSLGECLEDLTGNLSLARESSEWYQRTLEKSLTQGKRILEQSRGVDLERQTKRKEKAKAKLHCVRCGAASLGGCYCGQCGRVLASFTDCGGCKATLVIPSDLLPEGQPYHCPHCGELT